MSEAKELRGQLSFLKPRGTQVPIKYGEDEKSLTFYPVSVRRLLSLRMIGQELAKSLTVLFSADKSSLMDAKRTTRKSESDGFVETIFEPTPLATLEYRATSRSQAIDAAMNCLFAEENQKIVAELIADSLRDTDNDMLELDADIYRQMLMAMLKANSKVLGPLEERFRALLTSLRNKVEERLNPEPEPMQESSVLPKPSEGSGSSSKSSGTPSSEQPAQESQNVD